MKTFLMFLGFLIAFVLGFVYDNMITRIPEDILTCSHMSVLEGEIKKYYQHSGRVPSSLDELPLGQREHCKQNAWGGPISYAVTNGSEIVLQTYGRGGAEAKTVQTFVRRFDAKR